MRRIVEPEILDSLPEGDPAALANRRDIHRLNFLMGNYRWILRRLRSLQPPADSILELGAGAGDLGRYLRRNHAAPKDGVAGLDLSSRPPDWPEHWPWFCEDVLRFDGFDHYPVIIANLLLHQFQDDELRGLGTKLRRSARALLFVEPARKRLHQWQLKLLAPFGLHPVSRHDGHVSIAAGFLGNELPDLLGLKDDDWFVRIEITKLGAYRLAATRRSGKAARPEMPPDP